jgi:hypothetical protein
MSAPLTYFSKVFGFATESNILIDSEGDWLTMPPAGKVFIVPKNL